MTKNKKEEAEKLARECLDILDDWFAVRFRAPLSEEEKENIIQRLASVISRLVTNRPVLTWLKRIKE